MSQRRTREQQVESLYQLGRFSVIPMSRADFVRQLTEAEERGAHESNADNERLWKGIKNAVACFDAAEAEGLSDRLVESDDSDPGSLFGLITRRLQYARQYLLETLSAIPQPLTVRTDRERLDWLARNAGCLKEIADHFDWMGRDGESRAKKLRIDIDEAMHIATSCVEHAAYDPYDKLGVEWTGIPTLRADREGLHVVRRRTTKALEIVRWYIHPDGRGQILSMSVEDSLRIYDRYFGPLFTNGMAADVFLDVDEGENWGNDPAVVIENYDPFELVEMQTEFLGPNIWGYHDGASNYVFATEAECRAAIDAAMDRKGQGDA